MRSGGSAGWRWSGQRCVKCAPISTFPADRWTLSRNIGTMCSGNILVVLLVVLLVVYTVFY